MQGKTNAGFLPRMHSWTPREAVSVSRADKDLPQPRSGGGQSDKSQDTYSPSHPRKGNGFFVAWGFRFPASQASFLCRFSRDAQNGSREQHYIL